MLIILLFAWATAACAQTIYYATFRGDNYAQKLWHTASLAAFKAAPPDDVYDSYTVEARRDGSISCGATTALPPAIGDSSSPTSTGRDRRLHKLHSEFVTFGGITVSGEDEGLTRCIRDFTVSSRGTLQKASERIIDQKTGRKVARQFYDPQVEHWMRLEDLPIPPKA